MYFPFSVAFVLLLSAAAGGELSFVGGELGGTSFPAEMAPTFVDPERFSLSQHWMLEKVAQFAFMVALNILRNSV